MKASILMMSFLFCFNAQSNIEYSASENGKATAAEIERSRSCFYEVKTQGCGDPGDDINHFRSCLSNIYPTLTENCKKMMSNLYGTK